MPPDINDDFNTLFEEKDSSKSEEVTPRKYEIVWYMVAYFSLLHAGAVFGAYLVTEALWTTLAFNFVYYVMSCLGITAGSHRLWTHKSYKAKLPLEIALMLFQSSTNTHTLITWIRDHLLHHRYTDTDADPHNAKRGFFYSHIGWLIVKKHPDCKNKSVDLTELYANPVLRFQQKYAVAVISLCTFIIPTAIPMLWGESYKVSFFVNLFRASVVLNASLLVNSAAHMWGTKPYDSTILPVQNNLVSFVAFGEGFHNYHHVFPHDYRTSEIGDNYLNFTTKFIDFCAWIGQVYDRKSVSDDMILSRMERTGKFSEKIK